MWTVDGTQTFRNGESSPSFTIEAFADLIEQYCRHKDGVLHHLLPQQYREVPLPYAIRLQQHELP